MISFPLALKKRFTSENLPDLFINTFKITTDIISNLLGSPKRKLDIDSSYRSNEWPSFKIIWEKNQYIFRNMELLKQFYFGLIHLYLNSAGNSKWDLLVLLRHQKHLRLVIFDMCCCTNAKRNSRGATALKLL